ncbi:MAG TPA: UbiA family prenyltransferase [Methanotrichaceae archaeon]|nr:UbiA family prenyltransferase [Methanotrichaceae archaeon]
MIRLDYSFFIALGVPLSGVLSNDLDGFGPEYLVASVIVFLVATGSFAFNDYRDFEVDMKNSRLDRPLVTGSLPRRAALLTALVSYTFALLLSSFLNPIAQFLVLVSTPLFVLYSLGLKRLILLKNVLIAYSYVATVFLGSLISDAVLEPLILYFAMMGFIVVVAFEIMLDIGDVEGDRALGIDTFPTRFGVRRAAEASVLLYGLIMVLDPLPFFAMIDPRLYGDRLFLLMILVPVASYALISKGLMKDQSRERIFRLKKWTFLTMQWGCVAYLLGVLL